MSKELEALEPSVVLKFIDDLLKRYENKTDYNIYITKDWLLEIKQNLKRLETIDNANPSEALECLERIDNTLCLNNIKGKLEFGIDTEEHTDCDSVIGMTEDLEYIKQVLLKSQKEHKALEIIKKKCLTNCNLALVKDNLHYQNYCKEFEYFLNKYNESPNGFEITKEDLFTEEEFELLKEVLGE